MTSDAPMPKRDTDPLFVQQVEFEADIDRYVELAEAGQVIGLVRDDRVVCWLQHFAR